MILPTNQQPFSITLFGPPPSLHPSFTHSDDPEEAEVAFEASIFIWLAFHVLPNERE